jgi:hypothetical protein
MRASGSCVLRAAVAPPVDLARGQAGSVRSLFDDERDQMIPRGSPAMSAAAATPRIGPMAIDTLSAWAIIAPAYQPQ